MKSGENVKVFQSERRMCLRKFPVFHGFEPTGDTNKAKGVGLILYPGAFVDPTQYSPFARSLAELGYHIAIVNFAFNFAITNFKRAEDVLKYKAWEDIKCWAIAGHSVGGVMASAYANNYAEKLKGVALLASYPPRKIFNGNLKGLGLKVSSIWGTKDGLTTEDDIEGSRSILPDSTKFVAIIGGNHTQYYYSETLQNRDNEADITRDEQQIQIRKATHELLVEISE